MRFIVLIFGVITGLVVCVATSNAQVILNKVADMNFGDLGYDTGHNGNLRLGTNGNLSVSGGTGLSTENDGNAGSVQITANPTDVVEIKCETTGKLRFGNNSVDLQNTEVAINFGVPFGSGHACNGTKKNSTPATVVDLITNPSPVVLMGGELVIGLNSLAAGTYSTQSGGGQPVTLSVVVQ